MYTRRSEDIQGNRLFIKHRSSHQRYFITKGVLRNFAKIHRKTHVPKSPFQTPGGSRKGPMKWGLFVLPSFRSSVRRSVWPGVYLELYHYFCLNFGMVLETHLKLCMSESDFPEKCFFCPQNYENGPKTGFLKFNVRNNNNYFGLIQVFY